MSTRGAFLLSRSDSGTIPEAMIGIGGADHETATARCRVERNSRRHHPSHARQDLRHRLAKFQCTRCRHDALRRPQEQRVIAADGAAARASGLPLMA